MTQTGMLYGVGVGPGDPSLLTKKAIDILAKVEAVSYPKTPSGRTMALDIASGYLSDSVDHLPFFLPMKPDRAPGMAAYDQAAAMLAAELDTGRAIAVLCEGDPFYYGSFMYLHQRLIGQYPIEVVPGVTSLTAAAAVLGRPLAARNDRLKILPAPMDPSVLHRELCDSESIAIIKVGRHFPTIRSIIEDAGLADQAFVVSQATLEGQSIDRLDRISPGDARYFSTVLIYQGDELFGQESAW